MSTTQQLQIHGTNSNDNHDDDDQKLDQPDPDSGNPPDSFWVAEDEEVNWFNRNAFMQRKGSLKVILSRNYDPHSKTPSRRSLNNHHKPKTSIIGLPNTNNIGGGDGRRNRLVGNNGMSMFRSRSVPGETRVGTEPGSPRVSCMGKVGSKKNKGNNKPRFWAVLKAALLNRKEG